MTAAAWSVNTNDGSYRTDGTYSEGSVPSYGVRLLVLAAKVSAIGVLWVRDGATDYGTTSLIFRVAFRRWCDWCGWAT